MRIPPNDLVQVRLGSEDVVNPNIIDDAHRLRGVWNDAYAP